MPNSFAGCFIRIENANMEDCRLSGIDLAQGGRNERVKMNVSIGCPIAAIQPHCRRVGWWENRGIFCKQVTGKPELCWIHTIIELAGSHICSEDK